MLARSHRCAGKWLPSPARWRARASFFPFREARRTRSRAAWSKCSCRTFTPDRPPRRTPVEREMEHRRYRREVEEIEIAIVAGDGDHEEAGGEGERRQQHERHRDVGRCAPCEQEDERDECQYDEEGVRQDGRAHEAFGVE